VPKKYRSKANSAIKGNEKDEDNEREAQFSLYTRLEYKLDEEDDTTYWGIASDARTLLNFAYGRSRGVDERYSSLPLVVYNEVAELRSSLPLVVYNKVAKLRSSLPPAVYNREVYNWEVAELRSSLPPAVYNREVEITKYFTNETLTHFQVYLITNINSSIRTID